MWLVSLAVAGALFGSPGPPGAASAPEDLASALSGLSSPSGRERARAERWLGRHLTPEHFALVAETAQNGGPEARRRLGRALGADARHFTLAALFLGEERPELANVGEEAIVRLGARWNPELFEPPLTGQALRRALSERAERRRPEVLVVEAGAPLRETLGAMARLGHLPVGWAIEGSFSAPVAPGGERLSGSWDQLLAELARRHGAILRGYGFGDDPALPPGFVVFSSRREGEPTGVAQILAWCRRMAAPAGVGADEAALNLARSRWPAALSWLEARFHRSGDPMAGEGLLEAAAEGRVAVSLRDPDLLRGWVARASQALEASDEPSLRRGHRLLRALGRIGCRGPEGADLVVDVLAGWRTDGPAGRWLRLAVLEAWGCPSAGVGELVAAALEPTEPAFLARQALRTAAQVGGSGAVPWPPHPWPSDPGPWWEGLEAPEEIEEWTRLLPRLGWAPPAAWRDPGALPGTWGTPQRVACCLWWLGVDETSTAARHLVQLLAGGGEEARRAGELAAELLRPRFERGEIGVILGWLEEARLQSDDPAVRQRLDRTALLIGALTNARLAQLLTQANEDLSWQRDPAVLGALGGRSDGTGEVARETLVRALGSRDGEGGSGEPPAEIFLALERVWERLYGDGLMELGDALLKRVEAVAAEQSGRPWAAALRQRRWPLPPRVDRRSLTERERHLVPGRR